MRQCDGSRVGLKFRDLTMVKRGFLRCNAGLLEGSPCFFSTKVVQHNCVKRGWKTHGDFGMEKPSLA